LFEKLKDHLNRDKDAEAGREPHEWLALTFARGIITALILTGVWMGVIHEVRKVLG
jgi:hypothetical protein